ncbi:hypothetical protein H9Q13_06940 [Pontibacter sp. JH31]|uniref:Uncharacterized protein n=1 Tax=Pontibacter aquaedesilientis TaxID=2766980 RepID=A0ABR7XF26_9BACT|nr:hypothetical protein [Pontibacter aquaedesilientis]MBD1396895.1 hypothetical protein [Pontibacter aquaedesilientis]
METLNWKQNGWTGRKYSISAPNGPIGKLDFKGWSSYDADFSSERINLTFRNKGWFQQEVTIRFNGEEVGNAETSAFGKTYINLVSGERYKLECKTFSSSRTLVDEQGNPVVRFDQGSFSGTKGTIALHSEVPELTKLLLVATGLYFKTLADSQTAVLIAVFMPIFLQMIR